ncbi:MAG TPA: GDP-mannose 4,6-dehydratase, partial [Patescibacteria group bacterium]|nr:GDP-mannose 4,6-dehydratase [Patescibacteria group bacterium]
MKIMVTGGAGFIGANFIQYWMRQHPDDDVVNFDALTYAGNLENLIFVEKNPHYRFVRGDICDSIGVKDAMRGCDVVVHFAAESHVDRSIMDPSSFVRTNVLGTQVLLDAAKDLNISRFHHVSTDEVFGSLELGS